MKIAIIGCGLAGEKRARNLGEHQLVITADTDIVRAKKVAGLFNVPPVAVDDWRIASGNPEVEIVIVATPHNLLAEIALHALEHGKHVLIEKPGARSTDELLPVQHKASETGLVVWVGFNHRYHPALLKAKTIVDSGELGDLMFIRGRYGHGGRMGYADEWRTNPQISGGGELIDQGVHLIDLARWFLGDFTQAEGTIETFFWDIPVEDNAFLNLRTAAGQVAWLHASWSEWKNTFSLEIYGRKGKLQIDGLGGSYGLERLSYYKMLPTLGPPETTIWEFPGADQSWEKEFSAFLKPVQSGRESCSNLKDAIAVLQIVDKIYLGRNK